MNKGNIARRAATFAFVFILSVLLLTLFPFYPLYIAIALALAAGLLALEFPFLGLMLALILSILGAMYQDALVGLTFLAVFVVLTAVAMSWFDVALVASAWVLAFHTIPSLAIVPTLFAGLHQGRQDAVKVGLVSAVTLFLLAWARGTVNLGLLLVSAPNNYLARAIPDPWGFVDFIPKAEVFTADRLSAFYAPILSDIGDYRIYVLLAMWAVAGYLTALLAAKRKGRGPLYILAPLAGAVPSVAVSAVFVGLDPLGLGAALGGAAVIGALYMYVRPLAVVPGLPVFRGLDNLTPVGLPGKYSILFGAPSSDERNLIVEQFIQAGIKKGQAAFLLTSDTGFAESARSKFGDKFYAVVANPRATSSDKNLVAVTTGLQNLTALNIELVNKVKDYAGSPARTCLDVLSEVLLAQKVMTTRKWVTDIVPRLKNWNFTTLGVINPTLHPNEEVQALVELFDAYVEMYDKDVGGRTRKVVAVRKMADLRYEENELVVDKGLLVQKRGGSRFLQKA